MSTIALSTTLLATVLAGPFINALAFYDGPRWLAAYGMLLAMGALSTAFAIAVTVALFRALGPKRTRLISQIVSAVVGAGFVIGAQAAAIISTGSLSRISFLRSEDLVALVPEAAHLIWWPARAAMGNLGALAVALVIGLGLLILVIAVFSPNFGDHVVAASGVAFERRKKHQRREAFRPASTRRALRRKEWTLLRRDPWLMSQTLMQILYLLPPALLLWRNFGDNLEGLLILVPVIVMASGQLAGGLAWLAVSGEDAPDLVASAPIPARAVIAAKIEAVLGAVAMVVAPLILALALAAPKTAAVAALGVAVSAASGTMIQIWFRAQAKRSNFRRRQISSRIATVAEALSSILWAGTAALVAAGSWFASATALLALLTLAGTWIIRPRQANGP
jgi:ABC-2 type transport system permease protein